MSKTFYAQYQLFMSSVFNKTAIVHGRLHEENIFENEYFISKLYLTEVQ